MKKNQIFITQTQVAGANLKKDEEFIRPLAAEDV